MRALLSLLSLVKKEVDGVRPYWYAVVIALAFLVLDHTIAPMAGWPNSEVLTLGIDDWAFLGGLLAFSLAHTLVAVEYTDGHIEFLDGLPVERWMVFVSKVVAVISPLVLLVVGTCTIKLAVLWLLGTPYAVDPTLGVAVYGLRLSAMLVAYAGLGMLASWAGGLGWGVLLLLVFGMLTASVAAPDTRPYVLFDGMLNFEWEGGRPVQLWGPVLLWSVVGLLSAALSGLLFLGPGQWLVKAGSWSATFVRAGGLGCGMIIFFMCSGLATCDMVVMQSGRLLASTERAQTEHFRVLYPAGDKNRAMFLVNAAELISSRLGEQMGNDEPLYLDIEMLGAQRGHAGVFLGGKIRMSLDEDARDTLTHELAHAHAFALSGWKVKHQYEHVRFFEEGLAMYYEQLNSDSPTDYRWAALVWATEQARFDLLVEDGIRSARYDGDQAYPLGEQFVRALVAEHGDDSVACILRAIGQIRDDDIAGITLWVEAMNTCEYDLDAVVARYDELLEIEAASLPDVLPDLSARIVPHLNSLQVTDHNAVAGTTLSCRFRDDSDTPRPQWEVRYVRDGRCNIPATALSGTSFEYQLGFELQTGDWPLYHEWVTAEL